MPYFAVRPSSRIVSIALMALILIYGAITGLQTTVDFDLGWQMASTRHLFAATDTLSYTVAGTPWIYPAFAGILFRQLFTLGSYAAISYFCALALLATLLITVLRVNNATRIFLLFSVPALAAQMIPRSGLFTVLLAAAFTRILIEHLLHNRSRTLCLLPALMLLWVNLHTGFLAGLGMMLGYLVAESLEALRPSQRADAFHRIRRAVPWIAASFLATLINPFGFRIYPATLSLQHLSAIQPSVIPELIPLYKEFSWSELRLFTPSTTIWWMLAISILAVAVLTWHRRIGAAFFLAASILACLLSARSQGVFLPIACLLTGEACILTAARIRHPIHLPPWANPRWAILVIAIIFTAWRCTGILTGSTALRERQITFFGAGPSWWIPQRAADFVERNHLPAELFSDFNLSSYLTWRLGPHYRDFADGRYLPFGRQLIAQQMQLTSTPLDSQAWQQAAAQYNIRTVILPLSRFFGIESVPLREDCASRNWAPVYLDSTAIVLVRKDSVPSAQLSALQIDCFRQQLINADNPPASGRARLEHYQQLANAAVLYFVLGRNADAESTLAAAQRIATGDDSLVILQGQLVASRGNLPAAEQSFREALRMHPSDAAWYQLGFLYASQGRYPEAVQSLRSALQLDAYPNFDIVWALAKAEALNGETEAALRTLQDALSLIANAGPDASVARANIYDVEAAEYSQLSALPNAIVAEENAVKETPAAANRWKMLANLYAASGQPQQAQAAQQKADSLSSSASH